jgi:RNA polymerase sigma-70 factor, ECF subfamily
MTEGLAALVIEHSAFVWRVLSHLGVPRERLEDASQEVFLVLLDRMPTFRGQSSLKTWLYGVCRNIARAERRRHLRREIPSDPLPEKVVQPAQEGELWIRRAHEQLVRALSALDDEQRQVFILFELEELPMDEIAKLTRTPLKTCYSRLYSSRDRVHAELRRRSLSRAGSKVGSQ